jgi:hypothetical protein
VTDAFDPFAPPGRAPSEPPAPVPSGVGVDTGAGAVAEPGPPSVASGPGELGEEARAVAAERAAELAALRRAQADLADVDHALARLDDGTYGTCEACGVVLADDVLAEAPAARTCAAHAVPA